MSLEALTTPRSARDVLEWTRLTVTPHLQAAVAGLDAASRRIAEYQFEHGSYLRSALTVLAAEAVGGTADPRIVTAIELAHVHCELHDDVVHETRRGQATAWSHYGLESTVETADELLEIAFHLLAGNGRAVRMLNTALLAVVDGVIEDAETETPGPPDLAACVRRATSAGALMACACAMGTLSGGGSRAQVEHLRAFGGHVGLVYQHVEDLVGIWGEPRYADLHRRRRSLPVVAAMTSGTREGRDLKTLYLADEPMDAQRAADLVDAAGGRTWSLHEIDGLLVRALQRLRAAEPGAKAADELFALARHAARHDH
ncbi:dimethylallyltransferase [Lentzea sp. NBRC 105346]|uniref:polyprenyl synthetase family protein n=1 Tax=Lentzea sp. NBRC 105346 TaxID=3032205 RepID=UPI0024A3D0F9|nr:polyprenyl synthetase family protein [Lentzea sp. NBRC 105346]GLZ35078.1 dimethylallyltransferase [Lentzea sp. NBRC 105346]